MSRRSLLLAASATCISIIVALSLGEIFLRVAGVKSSLVYQPSPYYGWGHTPNLEFEWSSEGSSQLIRINSLGMRDVEIRRSPPPNTRRILVLGDSFTEALQVPLEDSFTKRMERDLESMLSAQGPSYEVLNAGVSGYGTDNELLYFRKEGSSFEPDLVILALYVGNDVRNNWYELENIDAGGARKPYFIPGNDGLDLKSFPFAQHASMATRIKTTLNRHLVLYSFLRELRERFRHRDPGTGPAAGIPLDLGLFMADYTQPWDTAWYVTENLIRLLNADVEAAGAELLIVLIPTQFQVDPQNWEERLAKRPALAAFDWDLDKPNRLFAAFLETMDIEFLDLLPALRSARAAGVKGLYVPRDAHWSAAGHEVAAEQISQHIVRNVILSSNRPGAGID